MTLLGFKTILHKKCRSGKNSEGPSENSWTYVQQNENNFKKSVIGKYCVLKCINIELHKIDNVN